MKYFKIPNLILLCLTVSLIISCEALFDDEDIITNPNAVTDVDVRTLLSGTLLGASILHEDTDVRIVSLWSRQINGLARAHQGYSEYIVSSTNFTWNTLYPVGGQARLIQEKAEEIGDARIKGVGQVIEALVITKATSLYGDVPYSQAFKEDEFPTPIYDSQEVVYEALHETLDDAIINLSTSSGLNFSEQDFIFNGDVNKWREAAYTLKARLYLHTGNYSLAIVAASSGISSVNGDALIPHGTSQGVDTNQNYDFFRVSFAGDVSYDGAYLPVLMQSRINSTNTKTNETALFNHFATEGLTAQDSLDPNTDDGVFKSDASHPLLTYYENQLILAESNARLGNEELALIALNNIREELSTGYYNGDTIPEDGRLYEDYVAQDFAQAGLANPTNTTSSQEALLYEIISQRYTVLLMQYEIFNDYRRLAVALPVVELPIPLSVGDQKPQRLIYPEQQINTNPNTPNPAPDQFTNVSIFN